MIDIISGDAGRYLIFDEPVCSTVPLTGLIEYAGHEDCLSVRLADGKLRNQAGFRWIHEWKSAGGSVTARCAHRAGEYLLRFPGLSDFLIQLADRSIVVFPAQTTSFDTVAHLLVDQVIPRVLCHQGRVIVHASAAVLPDDRGIAFIGDSGRGKSTLATSFVQSGCALLTDDCLQLDKVGDKLLGLASYPSLRLWPESIKRLFSGAAPFQSFANYSQKQQLTFIDDERVRRGQVALDALFLLESPSSAKPGDLIRVNPVGGAAAAMALIEAAFVLDVVSREVVKENFRRVAAIAQSGVPVFRLSYPRRFEMLGEVRARVLAAVYE